MGYLHFRKPPDPYSIPIKAHYIPIWSVSIVKSQAWKKEILG